VARADVARLNRHYMLGVELKPRYLVVFRGFPEARKAREYGIPVVGDGVLAGSLHREGRRVARRGYPLLRGSTRGVQVSSQMFSDESKERGYRMAAVVVRSAVVAQVRRDCGSWAAPGSRRFHARKESDARRKEALSKLSLMGDDLSIVIVERRARMREAELRELVLVGLAQWAAENGVSRWIIELDESARKADNRALSNFSKSTVSSDFEYLHMAGPDEPILWVADLAAWAWTKGGHYRSKIEPLVTRRVVL